MRIWQTNQKGNAGAVSAREFSGVVVFRCLLFPAHTFACDSVPPASTSVDIARTSAAAATELAFTLSPTWNEAGSQHSFFSRISETEELAATLSAQAFHAHAIQA